MHHTHLPIPCAFAHHRHPREVFLLIGRWICCEQCLLGGCIMQHLDVPRVPTLHGSMQAADGHLRMHAWQPHSCNGMSDYSSSALRWLPLPSSATVRWLRQLSNSACGQQHAGHSSREQFALGPKPGRIRCESYYGQPQRRTGANFICESICM